MSTVAWDGRYLAADTQATTGDSRIGTMVKLYDLTHYALAVVGYVSFSHALALWLSGEGERPVPRENWYCSALIYDRHTRTMPNTEEDLLSFPSPLRYPSQKKEKP